MDTRAAAARWRETWESGWRRLDAGPIVALYREDAVFQSHPFRPTEPAAEYITRTLAEESAATCEFDEPIVDGDRTAVSWRGSTQLKDGGSEELRGVRDPCPGTVVGVTWVAARDGVRPLAGSDPGRAREVWGLTPNGV
jgi:hypothetical protein